nr:RNA-directed DNA polymerase, eukaryota [Tanacetum cinerariifolium]
MLCLNIQGLTHKAKKDCVKEFCISNKVNFLTLQEIKMESIELFDIKRCWGNFAFDYVHSASVGNSGGILCVWDNNLFMELNATVSDYFVMVRGTWVTNSKVLLIISVYAPQELTEKKLIWDYLCHVIANRKGEVIVMGDFNEVRNKNERFGLIYNVQGANAFNSFISSAGLEEFPLEDALSHGDYFEKILLDHRPIILRKSTYDYGPIPFRFLIICSKWMVLRKLVNEAWYEAPLDVSNAMLNLMYKLKYLKKKIRAWNGTRKSSKNSKYMLKTKLADLDVIINKGDASDDIISKRTEEMNSKHYHGILNKKRNQLSIRGVLTAGSWIENPILVKNEFLNHFKNRFERLKKVRLILNTDFPCKLTSIQQSDMESEVSNEEIKRTLIKKDVVSAVKHFFQSGSIPKGCNSSFIGLIPKSPDVKMVKEFRPISLIGSLYKIIAKIFANRLMLVLGDIVNEVQSDFVMDRQILDGLFILNKIFQWCKSKKKHSFIFKVDFEKAYDSVRWDYLDDVLKKFGFVERWCGWIQECLRSSWGSVIVKGSPTKEFQFFKGLKQRDPLSPFLFILIMESLHISFQRVVNAGSMPIYHMPIFNVPMKVLQRMKSIRCHFFNGVDLGSKKSIWVKWNNVLALKEKGLSKLFMVMTGKLKSVQNLVIRPYGVTLFRRWILLKNKKPRTGVEHSQLVDLLAKIEGVSLGAMNDRWTWALEGSGEFSVMSVRKLNDDRRLPVVSSKTRWIKAVPIKVNVHALKVRLDCLPTRLNISCRGLNIASILCPICGIAVESSRHLFFDCHVANAIFRKICRWWDVNFMEVSSYEE